MGFKEIAAYSTSHHATLVAVSKTKSNAQILALYKQGQLDFGENRVQEMLQKYEVLPKDIRWHQIGHLQKNKVKFIAPFVHLIHSVDSFELLEEIDKQAKKNNRTIACLLQIHIAQEESKFGLSFAQAKEILTGNRLSDLQNVIISGFMGMATNTESQEQIEGEFKSLYQFFLKIKESSKYASDMEWLSMGMSGDYKIALACGSNMLRIGSALFN